MNEISESTADSTQSHISKKDNSLTRQDSLSQRDRSFDEIIIDNSKMKHKFLSIAPRNKTRATFQEGFNLLKDSNIKKCSEVEDEFTFTLKMRKEVENKSGSTNTSWEMNQGDEQQFEKFLSSITTTTTAASSRIEGGGDEVKVKGRRIDEDSRPLAQHRSTSQLYPLPYMPPNSVQTFVSSTSSTFPPKRAQEPSHAAAAAPVVAPPPPGLMLLQQQQGRQRYESYFSEEHKTTKVFDLDACLSIPASGEEKVASSTNTTSKAGCSSDLSGLFFGQRKLWNWDIPKIPFESLTFKQWE